MNNSVAITGPGANMLTVMRDTNAPASRIYHIVPGKTVTIEGMTISNGLPYNSNGGGILNDHCTLTVKSCIVSGNTAPGGGGIFNDATNSGNASLTILNSAVSENQAPGNAGGGIYNAAYFNNSGGASLTILNSTISGNTSEDGAGIFNNNNGSGTAPLNITNSISRVILRRVSAEELETIMRHLR